MVDTTDTVEDKTSRRRTHGGGEVDHFTNCDRAGKHHSLMYVASLYHGEIHIFTSYVPAYLRWTWSYLIPSSSEAYRSNFLVDQ